MWSFGGLLPTVAVLFGRGLLVTDLQTDLDGAPAAHSPPFYPSPWMTGRGEWAEAYAKAKDFVSQLTLLEKVNLTTG
ncbi:unnamed protein product, partial [Diplocarpon coronariae]